MAWVQSLVRELRSHKPHGMTKKTNLKNKNTITSCCVYEYIGPGRHQLSGGQGGGYSRSFRRFQGSLCLCLAEPVPSVFSRQREGRDSPVTFFSRYPLRNISFSPFVSVSPPLPGGPHSDNLSPVHESKPLAFRRVTFAPLSLQETNCASFFGRCQNYTAPCQYSIRLVFIVSRAIIPSLLSLLA